MIPLQKIKSYLKLSDNTHDALLMVLLEGTISLAENILGSPLEQKTIMRLKDVFNSTIWLFEIEPIVEKVEVLMYGEKIRVDFVQNGHLVKLYFNLYKGEAIVTMKAGWVQIPSDVEFAIIKEVAYQFLQSMQGEGRLGKGSVSESIGGGNFSTSYQSSTFVDDLKRWRVV